MPIGRLTARRLVDAAERALRAALEAATVATAARSDIERLWRRLEPYTVQKISDALLQTRAARDLYETGGACPHPFRVLVDQIRQAEADGRDPLPYLRDGMVQLLLYAERVGEIERAAADPALRAGDYLWVHSLALRVNRLGRDDNGVWHIEFAQ